MNRNDLEKIYNSLLWNINYYKNRCIELRDKYYEVVDSDLGKRSLVFDEWIMCRSNGAALIDVLYENSMVARNEFYHEVDIEIGGDV